MVFEITERDNQRHGVIPKVAEQLGIGHDEVLLPGADAALRGRYGVRQMIRMAPQFVHSVRGEEEFGDEARITTRTPAPGLFANYTTWCFDTEGGLIRRLRFELRGAN